MSDLRAALIGYGLAGRYFHAPLIAAAPGLRLATVVTGNPERAAQVAGEHPEAEVLAAPDRVWEGADHDLVVIAAPNDVHATLAAAAVDRGLAVVDSQEAALRAGARPDLTRDWGSEPESRWGRLITGEDRGVVAV